MSKTPTSQASGAFASIPTGQRGAPPSLKPDDLSGIAEQLMNGDAYPAERCETMPLVGFVSILYVDGAHTLERSSDQRLRAIGLVGLGRCSERDKTCTLSDGRAMTQQQLYLEAIRCDPTCVYAYSNLALTLSDDESVTLSDGRAMNKCQLSSEAIGHVRRRSKVRTLTLFAAPDLPSLHLALLSPVKIVDSCNCQSSHEKQPSAKSSASVPASESVCLSSRSL